MLSSSAHGEGAGLLSYVDLCLWMLTSQLGSEWLQGRGFTALAKHMDAVSVLPGVDAYLKTSAAASPPATPPRPVEQKQAQYEHNTLSPAPRRSRHLPPGRPL